MFKTTLENLHDKVAKEEIKSPSIIVIGEVVNHQFLKCSPQPSDLKIEDINVMN